MSAPPPSASDAAPLARLLFGWALGPRRDYAILGVVAVAAIGFFAAELAIGHAPLQLALADAPGFYLAAGAIVVVAVLLVAALLNAVFGAVGPAEDER